MISRSSSILISRSSGPVQSGCRQALRWSIPGGRSRISATRSEILWPSSIPPPPGLAPCPITTSIASARRKSSGFIPYREGSNWYTNTEECSRSSAVMPPSPVVVDVPTAVAPRPSASLAAPDSAPKLMPAIVIGMSRRTGSRAYRVPITTSVPHRSR